MELVFQIAAGFVVGSLALELLEYIGQLAARFVVRVVVGQLKTTATAAQERTATPNSSPS